MDPTSPPDPYVATALICVLLALVVAMILAVANLDENGNKHWPPR